MYQPLPDFPPLFPPGKWWRIYVAALSEGYPGDTAMARAISMAGIKSREWMRFAVKNSTGSCSNTPEILSIPVEGGAGALKNRHPDTWTIAPRALQDSRKAALTLSTLYGPLPYYHLLEPEINLSVLLSLSLSGSCRDVCLSAFRAVNRILGLDNPEETAFLIESIRTRHRQIYELSLHFSRNFDPELSILDAVFRMGRQTIFALLPSF